MDFEELDGVNEQEAAAPAEEEEATDETAEGYEDETAEDEQESDSGAEQAQDRGGATPAQDARTNAVAAAARRRAEEQFRQQQTLLAQQQAAAAQAAADAQIAALFAGYVTPGGKPIQGVQDLKEWQAEKARTERARRRAAGKATPEDEQAILQETLEKSPVFQQVREMSEQLAQERQARQREEGQHRFETQMAEIGRLDPTVKGLEDIVNRPEFGRFDELMKSGNLDMVTCYKIAFFDTLSQKQAGAARQAAINQARSTGHLTGHSGNAPAGDGVEIPAGLLNQWKEMFPDKTAAQLRKLYNATL